MMLKTSKLEEIADWIGLIGGFILLAIGTVAASAIWATKRFADTENVEVQNLHFDLLIACLIISTVSAIAGNEEEDSMLRRLEVIPAVIVIATVPLLILTNTGNIVTWFILMAMLGLIETILNGVQIIEFLAGKAKKAKEALRKRHTDDILGRLPQKN